MFDIATDQNGFVGLDIYTQKPSNINVSRLIAVNVAQGWYIEAVARQVAGERVSYEVRSAPYRARRVFEIREGETFSELDEETFYKLLDKFRSAMDRNIFPANTPF